MSLYGSAILYSVDDQYKERRWEASYSSNWSAVTVLVGKYVVKKVTVTLKGTRLMVLRDTGEGESYELESSRVSYGRCANWNSGFSGSIAYLEVDGQILKLGGEALLPDHRYVARKGYKMDMLLSGPDFLDFVSCLDELGLGIPESRQGSPYREAPTTQRDEYTLVLRKSQWATSWKIPVGVGVGIMGNAVLFATVAAFFPRETLPYVFIALAELLGLSLAIFLARRGKARQPARLIISGRELRLESRSANGQLARALVEEIEVEPALYSTSGNPSNKFASLRLTFPEQEALVVMTDDVRLSWDTPAENVRAPKYVVGSAELLALASLSGLSETLSFDRTRWQV